MPKPRLPAVSVCVALAGLGVTLFVNRYEDSGLALMVVAVVILGVHVEYERKMRDSALDMAAWLIECAQFGTKNIQNASDIASLADVPRLRERHDTWVSILREAADLYLHPSDADALKMLHQIGTSRTLPALTPDDATIRHWAAERVNRLRELARRLETGQCTLKRRYRHKIEPPSLPGPA